jgi:hypothetical protein
MAMNLVSPSVSWFSRAATASQSDKAPPVPGSSPDKGAQDCVKRYPVDQFSLRNLRRGYTE